MARVFHTGEHEVTVVIGSRMVVIGLVSDRDHAMTHEELIERARKADTMGRDN